jgi:hypothetical protein
VKYKKIIPLIFLLLLLPILIFATKFVIDWRKNASGLPADITINIQPQGNISSSFWRNLSQGGEESNDMIKPVIAPIRNLQPELIRIDHIFDYYQVDKGNGQYDFSRLDGAINSIILTGARPMLSISYTPDAKEPADWNQWYQMVKATAYHYSVEKKIPGIYYEVWNEPDLFGGWHYGKDPNYSTLYIKTSQAVVDGAGSTNYKIGGPATTAYYSNWIKSLFKTATDNHLRLDFISWHKYSKNIADYEKDFDSLNQIISDYPQYFNIERLITETGPNPEPDIWYDTSLSGIHLLALTTKLIGKIHRIFPFEVIDGPSPRSSVSTGWGIISHDLKLKPRYYAIQFLNQLQGQILPLQGNGTWVSGLASKKNQTTQILLVNYDPQGSHAETFPLTVQGLTTGKYQFKTINYLGKTSVRIISTTTSFREMIYLEPNSAQIIEISPTKP